MRGLLQSIGDRLQAFIEQRDDVALVLCSPASDALPILTLFERLEESSTSDLFWSFTEGFTTSQTYADSVVKAFAAKHGAIRLGMENAGMTPWPPLPALTLAEDVPPARRLRELGAFSRKLLPVPNGGTLVWIFYPLEVADYTEFANLMMQVVQHEFPNPWCHHLRFIIREDPAERSLGMLAGAPRIQWYQPDLSMEALQRSMEEEVEDESLSVAERLNNVPVLAGIDVANRRYPEALEKYELLLQYHAPMGNYTMAAVALNGMGEAYEKLGDLERASESYQAALVPASQGEHPPIAVLLNIVLNLANLRHEQERWGEGEAYYDMAKDLATVARDGPTKVRALEYRGVCQQRQGKLEEAEKSWYDGSVIAAQLEELDLCRRLVARLRQHYAETGQVVQERERRDQLAALGEPMNA
jgi:tetratricopeptide (TPR) repeat protein